MQVPAVVWLAARMAAHGDITIGEMVAVYGYVTVLIVPVWFLLGREFMPVDAVKHVLAAMQPASTIRRPKLNENTESSLVRAETSSQTTVAISGVRISAWAWSAAVEAGTSGASQR